jgi:glycosyltransferase involved in cell wall biosynthesis
MQRAGTNWLYQKLIDHPDFWMPPIKDIHYFDRPFPDKRYERALRKARKGLEGTFRQASSRTTQRADGFLQSFETAFSAPYDLKNYAALFAEKDDRLSGDITPAYSTLADPIIRNIAEAFPKLKIVLLIRDPIERAWSQLCLNQKRSERHSLSALSQGEFADLLHDKAFASRSFQSKIYMQWSRYFDPSRLSYFFFDDIEQDSARCFDDISTFLGARTAPSDQHSAEFTANSNSESLDAHPEYRQALIRHFGTEISEGAAVFGGRALEWEQRYKLDTLAETAIRSAVTPRLAGSRSINWIVGPAENLNWAYGNNARRLAGMLGEYEHTIASDKTSDIAVYFDPIVAERYPVDANISVLRIGGPRPLDRLFGEDVPMLADGLSRFDAFVPLSLSLYNRVGPARGLRAFIPNALDLAAWTVERRKRSAGKPFTVGLAASLGSSKEAAVKGLDIARAAAERAGVELLVTQKQAGNSIPHDQMIDDFYSRCDVLVHPVAPGREGTSNVIMEALALGLPVLTTKDAGLHGELLHDGRNALVRERSVEAFADAIIKLKNDKKLMTRLRAGGRLFAEQHHDLEVAGRRYRMLLQDLLSRSADRELQVCIVPFWSPPEQFASSRLRGLYAARALGSDSQLKATVGYSPDADIVIVVQMCDDGLLETLRSSGQFVVYDVCDRYFENERVFKLPSGPINSISRYKDLVELADLIITPTLELKAEVAVRNPEKPVVHVLEPIDYAPEPGRVRPLGRKRVLWFGNPDRGNFESVRWMLDGLAANHGYEICIVSRKSFFRKFPEYSSFVVDWSFDAMIAAMDDCDLCVVSHSGDEQTKSPNRMIAAVMHGLPTLVHNSSSCERLLVEGGGAAAIVKGPDDLARAVEAVESPEVRQAMMSTLQAYLDTCHGDRAIAASYASALTAHYPATDRTALRIGIVSHNLQLGEGAPRSLLELAAGLNRLDDVSVQAYSSGDGPLAGSYAEAGVELEIFDKQYLHCVKPLNERFGEVRASFHDFLRRHDIGVVICNTVKSAPFAYFARELGIPSIIIVRESFKPAMRFSHFKGEARMAAEVGLGEANEVVFVAEESRQAWKDHRFDGPVSIINNGVGIDRFSSWLGKTRQDARRTLGLHDDLIVSVCVGTIGERKGQRALVEAFAELPPAIRRKSLLLLVGAGEPRHLDPLNEALERLKRRLGKSVRYVGPTEDVGAYYRAADIFLMNSSNEAYPRSTMEAMLFGLPILSTRVFGVMTQVTDGVNGLLYDIGDMAGWKALFTQLITQPDLRKRLADRARTAFWGHTTAAEMLSRYRTLAGNLAARFE